LHHIVRDNVDTGADSSDDRHVGRNLTAITESLHRLLQHVVGLQTQFRQRSAMNSVLGHPVSLRMGDLKFIYPHTGMDNDACVGTWLGNYTILMSSTILRDIVLRGQEALVSQNGHHRGRSAEVTELRGQRRCSPT
jgi:hypothetical protein